MRAPLGSVPAHPVRQVFDANATVIFADIVIPGRGDPLANGGVVLKEEKIAWVGPQSQLPSKYSSSRPTRVPVLMPGLWDCHTHFLGLDVVSSFSGGLMNLLPSSNALIGAVTVDDLRATLMAGYTSVRECGGLAGDLEPAVASGHLVGPSIYSSICALSITGGHGDLHEMPIDAVLRAGEAGVPVGVCDGVEGCVRMVRKMIRRGAKVIKVCSSGGVLSLLDDPEDRQFSDEELKAMVDEAARSRRAVAAHAIGKNGIMAALRAGVKTVEHGCYLDEEVAEAMLEKEAILVPTQHIIHTLAENRDVLSPASRRKLEVVFSHAEEAYALAIKRGVKIALGTDCGSSDRGKPLSHGTNAKEIFWAVRHGMTPLQAIESATANGPETLGGMAPLSGQIREGYDADVIAVAENPLDGVEVLMDASKVTHVWKGGKLYKGP